MYLLPGLRLLEGCLRGAREISSDTMLIISAILVFLFAVSSVAWRRAARRLRLLKHAKAGVDADLAAVGKALENEIKWRLAAETFNTNMAKAPGNMAKAPGNMESKSTRELQELLHNEGFDGKQVSRAVTSGAGDES
jgi:hypothetical protein